jgi:dTDP-4-amino-4,6-dideoxygalactose transaminase
VGATPVFVDADRATRNIDLDPGRVRGHKENRAVIPVDLAGLPVDRDRLYDFAGRHALRVIEDAAQSMGANWKGREIGSFGDLVAISFQANKNLTTAEGRLSRHEHRGRGAAARRSCACRGSPASPTAALDVDVRGGKFNLTDIAAVIGLHQLPKLDGFNARRRASGEALLRALEPRSRMRAPPGGLRTERIGTCSKPLLPLDRMTITRGEFIERMKAEGVGVGVHYRPCTCSRFTARSVFGKASIRWAEEIGRSTWTLPLFPRDDERGRRARLCRVFEGSLARARSMTKPDVSVVIPATTRKPRCRRCLLVCTRARCLKTPYEVVFVDDGSGDRSAAMLADQHAKRPDATRVIVLSGNFGQHRAFLAGFAPCARSARW